MVNDDPAENPRRGSRPSSGAGDDARRMPRQRRVEPYQVPPPPRREPDFRRNFDRGVERGKKSGDDFFDRHEGGVILGLIAFGVLILVVFCGLGAWALYEGIMWLRRN